jgi:L-threonylcarbamoyladenylate synthase
LKTDIWHLKKAEPERDIIKKAAQIIKAGNLVAFPTETVYGLGANGLDSEAVKKIFEAKGRPNDNPLILHIANLKDVFYLASIIPLKAQVLMEEFWPGPLTLVFPKSKFIPEEITAGQETVAIRMPQHQVALALIREAGVPLAAPSANRSGYPSPTEADHVWKDLNGRIDAILDAGPTGLGLESTVLDISGEVPTILRPGGVTKEQLHEIIGQVEYDAGLLDASVIPKAPGMKYTHYSPRAEVILLDGEPNQVVGKLEVMVENYSLKGSKVGLLLTDEIYHKVKDISTTYIRNLGKRQDLDKIAQNIYKELRDCDTAGVDIILTETYQEEGLGTALMNRLLKSAGYKVIRC